MPRRGFGSSGRKKKKGRATITQPHSAHIHFS